MSKAGQTVLSGASTRARAPWNTSRRSVPSSSGLGTSPNIRVMVLANKHCLTAVVLSLRAERSNPHPVTHCDGDCRACPGLDPGVASRLAMTWRSPHTNGILHGQLPSRPPNNRGLHGHHARLHPHRHRDLRGAHSPAPWRQRTAAAAAARQPADARLLAQGGAAIGEALPCRGRRPARLRRQLRPARGTGQRQLLVPRDGTGPGRGDARSRLRSLLRRRPRPRRAHHASHVPRPSGQGG